MFNQRSETTRKRYPMSVILEAAGLSSAAWYRKKKETFGVKRGPKTVLSDEILLEETKAEIKRSKFHSEGYKKIHARMKKRGIRCGKNRVLKLLRHNNLLAPVRPVSNGSSRRHDGKIITDLPDIMWGTDGKQFYTEENGLCWFFGVIEHFNSEILSFHVAKKGNSFAALEPVKDAVKKRYGDLHEGVCCGVGLFLRSDHGTQYDAKVFKREIEFLGLQHSPAFVRSPECNGVIERFHRTLNEQVFSCMIFRNLEEARKEIEEFINKYNHEWIMHRLNYMTPLEYRKYREQLNCLKSA